MVEAGGYYLLMYGYKDAYYAMWEHPIPHSSLLPRPCTRSFYLFFFPPRREPYLQREK